MVYKQVEKLFFIFAISTIVSKNSNRRVKLSEEHREASSKYVSVHFYDPDKW